MWQNAVFFYLFFYFFSLWDMVDNDINAKVEYVSVSVSMCVCVCGKVKVSLSYKSTEYGIVSETTRCYNWKIFQQKNFK